MKSLNFLLLLMVISLLNGCAAPKPPIVVINTNAHQQYLASFDQWQLRGRLAFKSPDEKFSANLNWAQDQLQYEVKLTSFIGTSLLEMQGAPGFAKVYADDREFRDTDASRLIKELTGWNIPINHLPQWIKGQTHSSDEVIFDENGLVQRINTRCLMCDNWQITFGRYKQLDDVWLPHQITLVNQQAPDNQIKIRINQWNKT